MTNKKHTFKSSERLKSRKEISRIFKNGIFLYSDYLSLGFVESEEKINKFAVSVPKKMFKSAVIRNKLKRRIKESYRLNKSVLYDFSKETNRYFNILVIYKKKEILSYQKINEELISLLTILTDKA